MSTRQNRKSRYAQKLKDPRWQKKRLQILERDEWTCQECGDAETTLHVHHKRYGDGEPWEAPDAWLVTLCEDCHAVETEELPGALKTICDALRVQFSAHELDYLAWAFEHSCLPGNAKESVLAHFLMTPEHVQRVEESWFEIAAENRKRLYGDDSSEGEG